MRGFRFRGFVAGLTACGASIFFFAVAGAAQAPATTRIACLGDSVTWGTNLADVNAPVGTPESGYLGPLGVYLNANWKTVELVNEGFPGYTSEALLPLVPGILAGGRFDTMLLLIGTNDVGRLEPAMTLANIDAMATMALGKPQPVTPVLATLLPRFFPDQDVVVREINSGIKNIAARLGVPVADQYTNFQGRNFWLYSDPLHPNTEGYQAMAEEWASALTGTPIARIDLVAPVVESLEPPAGYPEASPFPEIRATLIEEGTGLDMAAVVMQVNGADVSWHGRASGSRIVITFTPDTAFGFRETVDVRIEAQDKAGPPNKTVARWSFTVTSGNGANGDVNGSGVVDGVDLILLGSAFGSSLGDPSYLVEADFDNNQVIDGVDLSILSHYFEK